MKWRFSIPLLIAVLCTFWSCRYGSKPSNQTSAILAASPSPIPTPTKPLKAEQIDKTWTLNCTFEAKSVESKHEGIRPYEISVDYPQITRDETTGTRQFNKWIRKKIRGYVAEFTQLEQSAERKDTRKRLPRIHITEALKIYFRVYHCDKGFLSMRLTHSVMASGQMHPIDYYETINYDLIRGDELCAADVFKPGFLKVFSEYSREELQRRYGFHELMEDWMTEGTAPKSDNFKNWNLVPEGVLISFEDYQIASHAFGQAEMIIPFSALKSVLRERSVTRRFVTTNGKVTDRFLRDSLAAG